MQSSFLLSAYIIYPDFISHEVDNRIIADAKYKPDDNIKSSDYQQLLALLQKTKDEVALVVGTTNGYEFLLGSLVILPFLYLTYLK